MSHTDRCHAIAYQVETQVFPLLLVFLLGMWVADGQEEAQHTVATARAEIAQARGALKQLQQACEPLLTLHIDATPLLIPTSAVQAKP